MPAPSWAHREAAASCSTCPWQADTQEVIDRARSPSEHSQQELGNPPVTTLPGREAQLSAQTGLKRLLPQPRLWMHRATISSPVSSGLKPRCSFALQAGVAVRAGQWDGRAGWEIIPAANGGRRGGAREACAPGPSTAQLAACSRCSREIGAVWGRRAHHGMCLAVCPSAECCAPPHGGWGKAEEGSQRDTSGGRGGGRAHRRRRDGPRGGSGRTHSAANTRPSRQRPRSRPVFMVGWLGRLRGLAEAGAREECGGALGTGHLWEPTL